MASQLETAEDHRNPYAGAPKRAAEKISGWPSFFKNPLGNRIAHLLKANDVAQTPSGNEDPRADWQDWQLRNIEAVHIEVTPPAGEL